MPQDLFIRDATLGDAATIAEIHNESIRAGGATMELALKTPEDVRKTIQGFAGRETYLLLERADGYVAGWGIIKRFGEGPVYHHACEMSVYLRHAEVRKGYGSYLKRAMIERCKAYGYHHVVARIWASNTASIEYNRHFGYELVGIQKEIGFVNGKWEDVALMQLVLEEGDS